MTGLEDLFKPRGTVGAGNTPEAAPVSLLAHFTNDLTSVSDTAFVRLESIDGGVTDYGPCGWVPRVDDLGNPVYPLAGNVCLLIFDDDDNPWIPVWWPAERVL